MNAPNKTSLHHTFLYPYNEIRNLGTNAVFFCCCLDFRPIRVSGSPKGVMYTCSIICVYFLLFLFLFHLIRLLPRSVYNFVCVVSYLPLCYHSHSSISISICERWCVVRTHDENTGKVFEMRYEYQQSNNLWSHCSNWF